MRFAAYVMAVLVAAGLIYFIGQSPQPVAATGDAAAELAVEEAPSATPAAGDAAAAQQLVTLNVPDMHCPFACYPAVKKTLEQQPGVLAVDLAEQKEEGLIDNPQVLVTFDDRFDRETAIDSLAKAGFDKTTVVP